MNQALERLTRLTRLTRPEEAESGLRARAAAIFSLGAVQLRQTWRLLASIAVVTLLLSVLVCSVALFSYVSNNAAVRRLWVDQPTMQTLTLQGAANYATSALYQQYDQHVATLARRGLPGEFDATPTAYISAAELNLIDPRTGQRSPLQAAVTVQAAAPALLARSLPLVRGRQPQPDAQANEVLLSQAEADFLHVDIGGTFTLGWWYNTARGEAFYPFPLTVVGIVTPSADPTLADFGPAALTPTQRVSTLPTRLFSVAIPSATLLRFVDTAYKALGNGDGEPGLDTVSVVKYLWQYHIVPSRVSYDHIGTMIGALGDFAATVDNDSQTTRYGVPGQTLQGAVLSSGGALAQFYARASITDIPVALMLLFIVLLVLLFISAVSELLVSRQSEVLAVLRSRGARRLDVIASLAAQSALIGVGVILISPLVTVALVAVLAGWLLAPADAPSVARLWQNPLATVGQIGWYVLLIALAAMLTLLISVVRVVFVDIVALRRESARSTARSLWSRYRADLILGMLALVVFGLSVYLTRNQVVNNTNNAIYAPLLIAGPLCLLLALALLFLRVFTYALRGLSWLAAHMRGASATLALALIARAPQRTVRTIILLMLSVAVITLTLIFTASQAQRVVTVASYRSVADFSGDLTGALAEATPTTATASYRKIPGVTSVSVGYESIYQPQAADQAGLLGNTPPPSRGVLVEAVDADTFAATANWSPEYSTQSLASLMEMLRAGRQAFSSTLIVPAIVDQTFLDTYGTTQGQTVPFEAANDIIGLSGNTLPIALTVVAVVNRLPPVAETPGTPATDSYASAGVMVDLQSLTKLKQDTVSQLLLFHDISPDIDPAAQFVAPNHVWLRTNGDAATLSRVRAALSQGQTQVANLFDRRAVVAALQNDPFYLNLTVVLQVGALVAFILILGGSLLMSWLGVRERLTSFAMLRAIGATPGLLARIFLWEQGITYGVALPLGIVIGWLLGTRLAQSLVYTGTEAVAPTLTQVNDAEFFALQTVPPVQVVVPSSLVSLLVVMAVVCVVAILWMARLAVRPSISQTLRLNED